MSQAWKDNRKGKPSYTETSPYLSQVYTINPAWTALASNPELYLDDFGINLTDLQKASIWYITPENEVNET